MVEAESKKKSGCCGGGSSKSDKTTTNTDKQIRMSESNKKTGPSKISGRPRKLDRNLEAKIILLGESGVGKSSIALRFCVDRFDEI